MRVMAVVAHPDDEVIGPGGTLAKHAMAGDTVHVVILAEGTTSRAGDSNHESSLRRSHEATRSAAELLKFSSSTRFDLADNRLDILPLLELAQRVEQEVAAVEPEVVFTHHPGDLNIDHELTARACTIACRPHASGVKWLLSFSTLSATEAGYASRPPFVPALYCDISSTLDVKLEAMRAYGAELRDFPHPRSLRAIEAQARLWGASGGSPAAEGFGVIRGNYDFPPVPGGSR